MLQLSEYATFDNLDIPVLLFQGLGNLIKITIFRKILDVAKSRNCCALLRARVDNAKCLIVDRTQPVLARGKLVLQIMSLVY